jgi:hypothetical protein
MDGSTSNRLGARYEAHLMRKMLDVAQEYLELQHLRIEVEKAEMELKKRLDQRDDRKKR